MILVGLDLESTGLHKVKDRPIEASATLWTTNFSRSLGSQTLLVQSDGVKVSPEVTEITGITQAMVDNFGVEPSFAFDAMMAFINRAEAIVAFNGRRFDIPMFREWARRLGKQFPEKLVIDPFEDLPMQGQELITMCAKRGIHYNAHEAGADVGAMLTLLSKFDFDVVLERAKSSVVVVRSKQDRSQNDRVKKHKFRWNPERKIWWKAVKEIDLNALAAKVNNEFGLEVLNLKPEDMETISDE
jgi:DNA polymerase III subunit epsilon